MKTVLFVIAATVAPLVAQRDEPRPARPRQSPLPIVIQRLADADEQRAFAAMHALIRGGKPAAKALRKVLADSKDQRFRRRAERILPLCEVDAPVRQGLKVGLSADRSELRSGDKVTLTATLCNVSDRDIVIFAGMSYAGNAFSNGSRLRRIEQPTAASKAVEHGVRWGVGFCGTGAYPLTVRIPALSAKTFPIEATYSDGLRPRKGAGRAVVGPVLTMGYCVLALGEDGGDGRYTVQLSHESRVVAGRRPKGAGRAVPNWLGKMRSNRLVLRTRR